MLSNLSNIPPCPGRIFPLSLTPISRFSLDSKRSPIVAKKGIIATIQYKSVRFSIKLNKLIKIT